MSGDIDECMFENVDEAHFIVNMDNGKTLCFSGEKKVKYIEVCSGGQAMTLVVRMTGGPDGRIEVPFMIVQNENPTTLFAAFLRMSLGLLSYKQKRFYEAARLG